MIVKLVEFNKFDVEKVMSFLKNHRKTQIVSFDVVVSEKHVIHSVNQCLKAFAQHRNYSKSEEIEFLIRLAGERQIKKVIEKSTPAKKSVFVSWNGSWKDFKKEFDFKELNFPVVSEKKEREALEKSATFWLSS